MLPQHLVNRHPNLLADGGQEKSEKDPRYNCVAWAAEWDKRRWWQSPPDEPGMYWPDGVLNDGSLRSYIALFESLGYKRCIENNSNLEVFYEKVVIYENWFGFTHVARQKYSGVWWSKMGEDEDVYHDSPDGLKDQNYGTPTHIMKRCCGLLGCVARCLF